MRSALPPPVTVFQAMSLAPGTRIGPYDVGGLLGAGGMGEVYRARDDRLNRDVALKTLPAAWLADHERVARFEREARMLATLNHPNVAIVYGLERLDGVLALAMELIDGETLEDRIRRVALPGRGLPVPVALDIARQLVAALDAAHEKGIVHRDLKPANIKLTSDEVVKVLDFGLAKAVTGTEASGDLADTRSLSWGITQGAAILGTPAYMSPEQARGQTVDRRADIWAFGCVLYEMLVGRKAFARDTASDTIAAVLEHDVDWTALPRDVPPGLRRTLALCLERNPKARLRDIADARLDFTADGTVAAPGDGSASSTPRVVESSRGVSRRHLLTGSAAAGLLGAAIGGGVVATRPGTTTTASYQRLTFRRGMIRTARFGPDFRTVLYGALWDGDACRIHTVRPDSPESSALALPPGSPLAISSTAELALALGTHHRGIMSYGTLARVPLSGGAPREVLEDVKSADWSPDGRDLAVVRRVGVADQLEFPMGSVIATPDRPTGGFSFARISPNGNAVAAFELDFVDGLTGRVVVVARSGEKRLVSDRYANVFGLAWKGDEVWFTAADELPLFRNAIHALSPSGRVRVVARVPGNTTLHDISPDGLVLIARTDDRGGVSVRVPGEAEERDLSWLDATSNVQISSDGRHVLFSEIGVGGGPRASVYLRGTDGSPAVRLGDGAAVALSPDGRWALARATTPSLEMIPTGAGQGRRIARAGLTLLSASWLADGQRLIVRATESGGPARLYLTAIDDETVVPLTPMDVVVPSAGWHTSPDGTAVAVTTPRGPQLFSLTGGPPRTVPDTTNQTTVVGWIDSGLLLLSEPQEDTVFLVDPGTGRRRLWARIQPRDPAGIMLMDLGLLRTTPDGRGYAYAWHRAISDLYLVRGWT